MEVKAFQKILIANRGEIALRVMRTCRRLGIAAVAVYSDTDVNSPHVRWADEAVHIGPSPSQESYLQIEKMIEAALRSGAEAIHPGYGFLSENADLAARCAAAGLQFIGPSAEVIRQMGLKSAARRIMADAGVPVVPGYDGEDQSPETLRRKALAMEFPVLIKASAGGGGKGIRVVGEAAEIGEAIEEARRVAEKSFGDGTLLIEKYIEKARHIEFQILGDAHGHLIHLFERDCSIQRRHQKVIEESPSPALTPELRQRIGAAAVAVGRAINYSGAGTVEFILAPTGEFYFIEVNTRLQVEHPVTEMITGLDLVQLQIEIAEGRPLSFTQDDLHRAGHAIEARLYAEDPANNFLPATGIIESFHPPSSIEGLRIDAGVETKSEVGIYYDPMLAKVIAHGADRQTALRKLCYGLRRLSVQGVQTNRDFLIRLLEHPDFRRGQFHTGFIAEHLSQLISEQDATRNLTAAIAVAFYLQQSRRAQDRTLPRIPLNFRNNPFRNPSVKLRAGSDVFDISYQLIGDEAYAVSGGDWQGRVQVISFQPGSIRLSLDGFQRLFQITHTGDQFHVHSFAGSSVVTRLARHPAPQAASEQETANASMPGQVSRILVTEGQQVTVGDSLLILEAMKMEQTIKAAVSGKVKTILVKAGDVVAPGEVLVQIAAS